MHTKQTCFLRLWNDCYETYNELWEYHFQFVQNGTKPRRTTLLLELRFQPSGIKGKQDVVSLLCWAAFNDSPWLINILSLGKCAYIKLSNTIAEIHSQPAIVIYAHLFWIAMRVVLLCFHGRCLWYFYSVISRGEKQEQIQVNRRKRLFDWTVWKAG